jgi:NAD(P)-dependent dehydrogenase (short-subunit alcohol dehydrogenase family)
MPLIGLYRASKAALNAWSESLAIEVRPLGIRVHVVLPGRSPETKFGENARAYFGGQDDPVYGAMVDAFIQMARDNRLASDARRRCREGHFCRCGRSKRTAVYRRR